MVNLTLKGTFRELGITLEAIDPNSKGTEKYAKIDKLIKQIKQLIFSEEKLGIVKSLFVQDAESLLRSFREKYKDLLKSLGIHICPSRKIIYRKGTWRRKKGNAFRASADQNNPIPKVKVYCSDCGSYHY